MCVCVSTLYVDVSTEKNKKKNISNVIRSWCLIKYMIRTYNVQWVYGRSMRIFSFSFAAPPKKTTTVLNSRTKFHLIPIPSIHTTHTRARVYEYYTIKQRVVYTMNKKYCTHNKYRINNNIIYAGLEYTLFYIHSLTICFIRRCRCRSVDCARSFSCCLCCSVLCALCFNIHENKQCVVPKYYSNIAIIV